MRLIEKLYPIQFVVFSPPFLISSPAPLPRSSQATRLVTSNARSPLPPGFTDARTHATSVFPGVDPQFCHLPSPTGPPPPPPDGGGAGTVVVKICVLDQGLTAWLSPVSLACTRQ